MGEMATFRGIAFTVTVLAVVAASCTGGITEASQPVESGRGAEVATSVPPLTAPAPDQGTPDLPDPDGALVGPASVQLPLGQFARDAASDGDQWWILVTREPPELGAPPPSEAALIGVNARTGDISAEVVLSGSPFVVAADDAAVWVAHWGTGAVTRVDPTTGVIIATVQLELPFDLGTGPDRRLFIPNDIQIGHNSVWVSTARGALARIDTVTNAVVDVIELTPLHPSRLAVGPADVWVAEDVHGLTRVDVGTHTVSTLPLADLGHAAQQVAVINGHVYVAGNRLGRDPDGSFRREAGGATFGDEVAVSRVDPDTLEVLGSATFDEPIVFLGWVNALFGVVDATGTFWRLHPLPRLVGEASLTNWADANHLVQVGREAWMINDRGARLLRLNEVGPAPTGLPFEVGDSREQRPVPDEVALSEDWVPLDRGPLAPRWPGVVAWTGEEIVLWGGEPVGGGSGLGGGAAYRPASEASPLTAEAHRTSPFPTTGGRNLSQCSRTGEPRFPRWLV